MSFFPVDMLNLPIMHLTTKRSIEGYLSANNVIKYITLEENIISIQQLPLCSIVHFILLRCSEQWFKRLF